MIFIADKEIVTIFTQISVTKREAEMKLDETDFFEKKMINKRKKLILAGMDPDEVEEFLENRFKHKRMKKRKIKSDAEQIKEEKEKKEGSDDESEETNNLTTKVKSPIQKEINKKDKTRQIESKSKILMKKSINKGKNKKDSDINLVKKRKKLKK